MKKNACDLVENACDLVEDIFRDHILKYIRAIAFQISDCDSVVGKLV